MTDAIPLPPIELRGIVGPTEPRDYDNPSGEPILAGFDVPLDAYRAVFDFGCGCGRQARQLLQQDPRPQRYVGIDVNPSLIEWCRAHLTPVNARFTFLHHDVYSPLYAPGNSLKLARPFPVEDSAFTLLLGSSIFTHLTKGQTEYYLSEVARILAPGGVAYTTWLFFDRASFTFLPGVHCLYTSEIDFGQAVLFDREWFIETVRSVGLSVQRTMTPEIPGHQWRLFLVRRTPGMIDDFPLGVEGAEWLSGATLKPMASVTLGDDLARHDRTSGIEISPERRSPPVLYGPLAELEEIRRSRSWKIAQALSRPVRMLRRAARFAGRRTGPNAATRADGPGR